MDDSAKVRGDTKNIKGYKEMGDCGEPWLTSFWKGHGI